MFELLRFFMRRYRMKWDMNGRSSYLEGRRNVALETVAHHHQFLRQHAQLTTKSAISFRFLRREHPTMRIGWYSGRSKLSAKVEKCNFDYVKLGPYIADKGCLKDRTTNQRLYKKASGDGFTDITYRFWAR